MRLIGYSLMRLFGKSAEIRLIRLTCLPAGRSVEKILSPALSKGKGARVGKLLADNYITLFALYGWESLIV
jgi:hypothetical protein